MTNAFLLVLQKQEILIRGVNDGQLDGVRSMHFNIASVAGINLKLLRNELENELTRNRDMYALFTLSNERAISQTVLRNKLQPSNLLCLYFVLDPFLRD